MYQDTCHKNPRPDLNPAVMHQKVSFFFFFFFFLFEEILQITQFLCLNFLDLIFITKMNIQCQTKKYLFFSLNRKSKRTFDICNWPNECSLAITSPKEMFSEGGFIFTCVALLSSFLCIWVPPSCLSNSLIRLYGDESVCQKGRIFKQSIKLVFLFCLYRRRRMLEIVHSPPFVFLYFL